MEHSGNTRTAYADCIGWPYCTDGTWRGYDAARQGVTWLNWCLVKRVARLAGLDDPDGIHPHVARHTFITEARRLGYAGDEIQHAVGHANLAQTDKYGIHVINLEKSPAYGVAARFAPDQP